MTWIRGGPKSLDATNISQAIDNRLLTPPSQFTFTLHRLLVEFNTHNSFASSIYLCSLLRMQLDYIDLYQIHWPDRFVPFSYFHIF